MAIVSRPFERCHHYLKVIWSDIAIGSRSSGAMSTLPQGQLERSRYCLREMPASRSLSLKQSMRFPADLNPVASSRYIGYPFVFYYQACWLPYQRRRLLLSKVNMLRILACVRTLELLKFRESPPPPFRRQTWKAISLRSWRE